MKRSDTTQIIICVETTRQANTDCFYVEKVLKEEYKETLQHKCKLSYVYMNSKSNYNSNSVERDIKKQKANFEENVVVYCIDTDNINIDETEKEYFDKIEEYCKRSGYFLVWFCENVEVVFVGHKVDKSKKIITAKQFGSNVPITQKLISNLKSSSKTTKKSNLLLIFDEILKK